MSETIVFFGSGPVAAKSLELLSSDFEIEVVITKPRKEGHRGPVPVIDIATTKDMPLLFATNKTELDELIGSSGLKSKLAILVDYGIIVSQKVIDYFPLGIINSHFSLLPEWRGADPITYSILSGQAETGVSLMLLSAGMDEGLILTQKSIRIEEKETTDTLTDKLIMLSDELLKEFVPKYINGDIKLQEQDSSIEPTYSHKISKEDGSIDWTKDAEVIEREIRAYSQWPKSYTSIAGNQLIITDASVINESGKSGDHEHTKDSLIVYCGKDALSINRLKPLGKKDMSVADYLRGYLRD